jgi:hypothetical protein
LKPPPSILRDVENAMRDLDLKPTRFGQLAARDPRLVADLRNGRVPTERMERRIRQFIATERKRPVTCGSDG